MTDEISPWVAAKTWREGWESLEKLPAGGQGEVFRARRLSDQCVGFLKVIKSKNDPERRARFFREASAYDAFKVNGVPRLLESNAHLHADMAHTPFIVTDFVKGPTLRAWREVQQNTDLEVAVTITRSLLDIVDACHAAGCVHRDVKPDNIILQDGDPRRPWLLDFGLNYHDMPEIDFQTEGWQEVGNRFLRLPELSAGSLLKQDPRSDLSFIAGILFYLITGEHPDVVRDAEGYLPHQRSRPFASLQSVAGKRFARFAAFFDTGFAPLIAHRFSNAKVMRVSLDNLMTDQAPSASAEDNLKAITALLNTSAERDRTQTVQAITDALSKVQAMFSAVQQELGGHLSITQMGYGVEDEMGTNTLFWTRIASPEKILSTTCEAARSGEELVFRLSGETVYRTGIAAPDYGEAFTNAIRAWLLAQINSALHDPNTLPRE